MGISQENKYADATQYIYNFNLSLEPKSDKLTSYIATWKTFLQTANHQ